MFLLSLADLDIPILITCEDQGIKSGLNAKLTPLIILNFTAGKLLRAACLGCQ